VGISASVVVITIGAIFAFGVRSSSGWIDLWLCGWILMLAGITGLGVTIYLWRARPREMLTQVPAKDFKTPDDRAVPNDTG
jgi:Domain of unknown function (DUF6458)